MPYLIPIFILSTCLLLLIFCSSYTSRLLSSLILSLYIHSILFLSLSSYSLIFPFSLSSTSPILIIIYTIRLNFYLPNIFLSHPRSHLFSLIFLFLFLSSFLLPFILLIIFNIQPHFTWPVPLFSPSHLIIIFPLSSLLPLLLSTPSPLLPELSD